MNKRLKVAMLGGVTLLCLSPLMTPGITTTMSVATKRYSIKHTLVTGSSSKHVSARRTIKAVSTIARMNPDQVYTYAAMQCDILRLAHTYPHLIHYEILGQTLYGRNIYAVSLGTGPATAFINGSHHAREWMTTTLNMYMIDQYARAYMTRKTIAGYDVRNLLSRTTLWFIPMVNPDGVTLVQFGDTAFPKRIRPSLVRMNHGSNNFSDWKANAQGIDLNRQYDGGWNQMWYDIVSHPWYEDYKGPKPYDTRETQAVLRLIRQVNPQIEAAYHSSGQVIYWGYKISSKNFSLDKRLAQGLANLTGYALVMPGPDPSGGGLTDWWTHNMLRPGFTIEIAPYVGPRPVPLSDFPDVWNKNKAVGLYLAAYADRSFASHKTIRNVP